MKHLKVFDEEGEHSEYYFADSTIYPNVGAYRENVLFDPNYSKVYFFSDDPTPTSTSAEE